MQNNYTIGIDMYRTKRIMAPEAIQLTGANKMYDRKFANRKRQFIDAPNAERCKADVTLSDGSKAQCGRRRKVGDLCLQHHKKQYN